MNIIGKIIAYTIGVLVVGCLLAPPLYWLVRYLVDTDVQPALETFGFAKCFSRVVLATALVSLWPFLRWLGLRHWTDLMLKPNPNRWVDLGTGAAIGAGGLTVLAMILVFSGVATVRDPVPWRALGPILFPAVVVPLVEEPLFRGALLGLLRQTLAWPWALAFLSFFFAILHFVKPIRGAPAITDVGWSSGFELLPHVFWQFRQLDLVLGGWVTLFLVGWILGYTVVRTQSLYMAIGMHGGWVYALRAFSRLTRRQSPESMWIGGHITVGLVAVLLMLVTLALVHRVLTRRRREVIG